MRTFKQYSLSGFVEWIQRLSVTRKIGHIQIHHTWKPRKSDYQGERTIRGMWNYHVQVNDWNDIGQHLSIAPDGTIWDGRNFNTDPAGIKGHNAGGVMIEIIGDFDRGQETLEGLQLQAVIGAVHALLKRFSLTTDNIVFHREHAAKTCPGSGIDKAWFIDQVKGWKDEAKVPASFTATDFPDVPDHYHGAKAIQAMKDLGIMVGHENGNFGFGSTVTKETLAVVLYKMINVLKLVQEK